MIKLQSSSHDVWNSKHRLKDYENNPIDKLPEDTLYRCARRLAEVEENDIDKWTDTFFLVFKRGCYPGGRILANAGAEKYKSETTLINCVVSSNILDSLKSIINVASENALTLKTGAGIGFCFSFIRPKGSFVNGVNAQTSGPLSFADIYDKICYTISSAGGRRGSMMLTFHVHHPDIFDVIKAKRESGRLRQFNITILITDEFIDAVKNDKEWKLYFPLHKNDPKKGEVIYKYWSVDDPNYIKNEIGETCCKVYQTISAREIWNAIIESNYKYAEPGFILIDKINSENNLYFCEDIVATNPSLVADTLVYTKKGIVPIQKLENKTFQVKTFANEWADATCWLSGKNEPIYEVEIYDNMIIGATAQHKWPIIDFESNLITRVRTDELKPNDFLLSNFFMELEFETSCFLTETDGFVIGLHINNSNNNDIIKLLSSSLDIELEKFKFPNIIWSSNKDFIRGFIKGFMQFNGIIDKKNLKEHIVIATINKNLLMNFAKLLSFHGILGKIIDAGSELIFSLTKGQYDSILNINNKEKTKEVAVQAVHKIKRIVKTNKTAPVWDIAVNHHTHSFAIEWGFTGNCGEQPLAPNNSCLLGSINLTQYIQNPFSENARINYRQIYEDIYIFNRALDNVVDISNLPFEIQRKELLKKRRHGIGFLGLGSLFNMMKLRYGSDETIEITREISKSIALSSIHAGLDLALEKGPAPIMNEKFEITHSMIRKSKKLKELIDTNVHSIGEELYGKELIIYSGYLSRMPNDLINRIREQGMRFSHATSIAPTGTMALGIGNNVSNGIEPTFSHEVIRNIIESGKKTKKATKVYSYESLMYKEQFGKDAPLPDYFVSTDDLQPIDHIRIQAAAQPWIDSSISKCIAKGTCIITNKGLLPIETISNPEKHKLDSFIDISDLDLSVLTSKGFYNVKDHYINGFAKTKIITFDFGIIKEVSLAHKFLNANNEWVTASNLKVGDKILYKPASKIKFDTTKTKRNKSYWAVIGILNNKYTSIKNNKLVNEFFDFNDSKIIKFFNNIFENIDLNNLDPNTIINIIKFKNELDLSELYSESLLNREIFISNLVSPDKQYIFKSQNEAQTFSEIAYVSGIDSGIIKMADTEYKVVFFNKNIIEQTKNENGFILSEITSISDSSNELYDISVNDVHEYLIHGLVSHNTINCPTEISMDDFANIYLQAYDHGLKSATTFRYNPVEGFQGVIVREKDLENTKYKVVLKDGSEYTFNGNSLIMYHGDVTTVANLYDAIKENQYGKF